MSEFEIKRASRQGIKPGLKLGRLTVLRFERNEKGKPVWICACECGNQTWKTSHFFYRNTKYPSCGCHHAEMRRMRVTHGHSRNGGKSAAYKAWLGMKTRCLNPHGKQIKTYHQRGITVCDRWLVFENFLADMGEPPPRMELDRIDNDKGYSPDNCRWLTHADQQRNKTNNFWVTYGGKTMIAKDWAAELGIHYATLLHRLKHGWTVEEAFSIRPVYRRAA